MASCNISAVNEDDIFLYSVSFSYFVFRFLFPSAFPSALFVYLSDSESESSKKSITLLEIGSFLFASSFSAESVFLLS
jgi:hypothetical protein